MQILNSNYQKFQVLPPQFKQKISSKQMLKLIDNCRSIDQIVVETGLAKKEVNDFCLKNFGKTYRNLKSERYKELITIANSNVAKKVWIYRLFAHKLQGKYRIDQLSPTKQKDAIRLWENGVSVESIAKSVRAKAEEVFDFLASRARDEGPIVG